MSGAGLKHERAIPAVLRKSGVSCSCAIGSTEKGSNYSSNLKSN